MKTKASFSHHHILLLFIITIIFYSEAYNNRLNSRKIYSVCVMKLVIVRLLQAKGDNKIIITTTKKDA